MASVWRRFQRVNKRAAKFQFTASFHELKVETTSKWRPTNLYVVWTRRSRRVVSTPLSWEPDLVDPLSANMVWQVPDNHTITVTLFRDPRTRELEDKDWTFAIEDVSAMGKKRILASHSINMRKYASIESTQQTFSLNLRPTSKKITSADLQLTLSCVFLREGKATDEDMMSIASMMSMNNNSDIAPLDELEDIEDLEISEELSEEILSMTQQVEQWTSNLNSSELPTPMSVPSLTEDRTPVIPNHIYDDIDDNKNFNEGNKIKPNSIWDMDFPNHGFNSKEASPRKEPILQEMNIVDAATLKNEEVVTQEPEIKLAVLDEFEIDLQDDKSDSITSPLKDIQKLVKAVEEQTQKLENEEQQKQVNDMEKAKNDLLKLDLKKNYEAHTENTESFVPPTKPIGLTVKKSSSDKTTPGQDLLEWCKEVTKDYPGVKVTNLTTSWRNGMAFCAVINHYQPELIDMSTLDPHDVMTNCRKAFEAAESLGIPKVIEPRDMNVLAVPDKLAVMTYLHQLRAYFTGNELEIERLGTKSDDTSYVIGNYRSDSNAAALLNIKDFKHLIHRNSFDEEMPNDLSPDTDTKNIFFHHPPKRPLISPGKEHSRRSPIREEGLKSSSSEESSEDSMQKGKKEQKAGSTPILINKQSPDYDDSDTNQRPSVSPPGFSFSSNNILKRHTELSEKAKAIIGKLKSPSIEIQEQDANEVERQERLRQEARALIAETRKKSLTLDLSSPTKQNNRLSGGGPLSPEKTISPINNLKEFMDSNGKLEHSNSSSSDELPNKQINNRIIRSDDVNNKNSPSRTITTAFGGKLESVSLQSFNAMLEKLSPRNETKLEKGDYYQKELDMLEREQEEIDSQARALEKKLRLVMDGTNANQKENEDKLMAQWFTLVNKKNALLRRQMQLNILEQENDLERKFQMLTLELRAASSVEEWRKTEEQREREALLLAELLKIVDKRNELVQNYDTQEQAIADDEEIQSNLEHIDINPKDKCSLM